MNTIQLTDEELATVLAALRHYQENGQYYATCRSNDIDAIATNCDTLVALGNEEIDDLCISINTGERDVKPLEKWDVYLYGHKFGYNIEVVPHGSDPVLAVWDYEPEEGETLELAFTIEAPNQLEWRPTLDAAEDDDAVQSE